ncbi:stage V sporulation protein AA [Blautia sp. CLA-JM-H16]|uniref:Stage V sporulation protein AA n=1 Tax=Blautia aquisgranensis TaxID=3133153 RepID=A0ABV1BDW7_9FIRM
MSDTLYLQLDQNIEVTNPHVYLQDIAALSSSNTKLLNRLRVMPVIILDSSRPGRYVLSVSELLKMIQKAEPSVDISPIGESSFIITYRISSATGILFRYIKIFFVCLVSFFGAAFSIMTFNNDVDLGGLFSQIYTLVMGKSSDGFTILEISYSIGIGLGVLIFFNHFGHLKLSDDPTPMQVQMRTYENDVNQTLIEQSERKISTGKDS